MKKLIFSVLLLLMVAIGAVAQETLTVCDGTATSSCIPFNGSYVNAQECTCEFVISAETEGMSDMEGGTISSLTFHISGSPDSWGSPTIKVYMGEVVGTTLSSISGPDNFTLVYTGIVSNTTNPLVIELSEPYTYGGGNLFIGTDVETASSIYKNTRFYGVSAASGSSIYYSSNLESAAPQSFLPKTTFSYELPATSCPKPTELAKSNLTARTVDLAWVAGGEETEWQICLNGNEDNLTVATNPYTLENLNPETAYTVKVRANCGSEQSRWSNTVSFTTLPTCPVPTELAYADVTTNSVVLSWTAGGSETAWQICLNNNETELIEVTENPYTLTGLDPATTYSVKVRANCGDTDGNSQWTSAVQFSTPISSLPYEQSFESTTCPAGGWSIEYAVANPHDDNIMNHVEDYAKEGSRSFRFSSYSRYSNTSDYNQYLISPMFNIEGSYVVSFYYRQRSENEHLYFGTSSTGNAVGDFTWTAEEIPAYSGTWKLYRTIVPAGTKYFAINYNPGESFWYAWIDNVVVREVSTAAEILTYSLPTQVADAAIGDGTIEVTVANSTDFDVDLTPTYTISENAEISDPVVTGEGDVRTIEYTVTAEAGNTKVWRVNITKAPVSHDAFITAFTFAGQKEGTTAEIGSENDPYIVNAVAEWNVDLSNIAPTVTVSLAATVVPESGVAQDFTADEPVTYTVTAEDGETSHTYTVTIVNDPDACINPATVNVTELTATTATLGWAQAYTETSYLVKVSTTAMTDMTATADVFDGTVEATTKALEGLTANTEYYVYVQSNCENAEDWTSVSFSTPCEAIELPYNEDFDSYSYGTQPDCWNVKFTGSSDSNQPRISTSFATSGNCFYIVSGGTNYGANNYIIMPNMNSDYSNVVVEFDSKMESTSFGRLYFGYITDINDASTFVSLETVPSSTSSNHHAYNLAERTIAAGSRLAFKWSYSSSWFQVGIDNVVVREIYHAAEIVDFNFPTRMTAPEIDNATVTATASYQADLENLDETVIVSDGAEYVAGATSIVGNVKTFTYTVTAEDGTTTKDWTVTVTKAESASTETDIVAFSFVGQVGESEIDPVEHTVTAYAEWDFDFENNTIAPTIEVSPMATISNDGEARNFFGSDENPVQYTVTAEDGTTTQIWNVTIVNDPNACINPDEITVENVTSTGATLNWDKRYQEASYIVKVSTVAYESEEELLAATEFVYNDIVALEGDEATLALTDLTPATYYYVYVQSNCENAESWTVTYFGTECDGSAYSVPFVETFDMSSNSVLCWTIIDANEDVNESGHGAWNFTDEDVFYYYSSYNAANDWLISPKIAVVDGAYLTFDYMASRWTEKFSVYVMSDIADYATATVIRETATVTNEEFASIDNIDLSAYAGQDIYIGIKCESEADQNVLYIDNFKVTLPVYTITATAGENGTIDPESAEVMYGYDKMFTITPDEGYRIATVVVDAETEGEANVTENVVAGDGYYTFTNVTANHTIHATFKKVYAITITANEGGVVTPSENQTVDAGEPFEFTVIANDCHEVESITINDNPVEIVESGEYTIETVDEAKAIEVTFAQPTYTITVAETENGTITHVVADEAAEGDAVVACGESMTFAITPAPGYVVATLTIDDEAAIAAETYTFADVRNNHSIAATFEQIPEGSYAVTVNVNGEGGTVNPVGTQSIEADGEFTLNVTTEDCHEVAVTVNGEAVELTEGQYTTTVTEALTINVTFSQPTYTITVAETQNGTITPAENVEINCGEDTTFTIRANEGYRIESVIVDEENVTEAVIAADGTYTFENVRDDHAIAATFKAVYAITIAANEGGVVNPSENQTVDAGDDFTFTVTANDCYEIATVTANGTELTPNEENNYVIENVAEAQAIEVTFNQITYTIAVEAGENGTITPNDEGTAVVNCGGNVTFTITPATNYMIATLTVDGNEVATSSTYTFTNVRNNAHTIAATFVEIPEGNVVVVVNATGNGTVDPMGTQAVESGTNFTMTITPDECYSALVDGNPVELDAEGHYIIGNVTENTTVNVSFEQNSYTIAASANEFGTIDPAGDITVNCGDNKTFTFVPADSCRLVSVMVDDVDTTASIVNNSFTFENVNGDHTIVATFQRIPTFTITVADTENGTITPNGIVTVLEGQDTTFTFVPADSCRLVSVMVDDVDTTASLVENTFTFANVTENHTLAATFQRIPTYTITVADTENGTITPNGIVTVLEGQDTTFTFVPADNYRLASVMVDDVDTTASVVDGIFTFVNVTANHTIAATFEEIPEPVTYTITVEVGEHGTVTYNGDTVRESVIVDEGATAAFVITPDEDYMIGVLTIDGVEVELTDEELAGLTYTFEDVDSIHTLAVTFVPVTSADMIEAGSMTVYPNPNNGMFSIDFSNIEGDATYQIIDARGAVVETRDINVMNGETMNFNHDLRPGAYFVRIINGDKVYVEQIVVE